MYRQQKTPKGINPKGGYILTRSIKGYYLEFE
jgi:hypothetical protein